MVSPRDPPVPVAPPASDRASSDFVPWAGFALAAADAVAHLHRALGMDLWMVTHVEGERQVVLSSAGPWADGVPVGSAFPWPESFCLRMVQQRGPMVAPVLSGVPDYSLVAVGALARVRAYLGVPLLTEDGTLFGTLCAFAGTPQSASLASGLEQVSLVGRLLSTILARELTARERSEEAAQAYALAERDRLTGLRNRRGWEAALSHEDQRCRRYGSPASVLAVDLDGLRGVNVRLGRDAGDKALVDCAAVLRATCRPGDALARVEGDEFGVLAVECDAVSVRALATRLRVQLRSAGIAASLGTATRRAGEGLAETWLRADAGMLADGRRRGRNTR